jgi:hypothetical protein
MRRHEWLITLHETGSWLAAHATRDAVTWLSLGLLFPLLAWEVFVAAPLALRNAVEPCAHQMTAVLRLSSTGITQQKPPFLLLATPLAVQQRWWGVHRAVPSAIGRGNFYEQTGAMAAVWAAAAVGAVEEEPSVPGATHVAHDGPARGVIIHISVPRTLLLLFLILSVLHPNADRPVGLAFKLATPTIVLIDFTRPFLCRLFRRDEGWEERWRRR